MRAQRRRVMASQRVCNVGCQGMARAPVRSAPFFHPAALRPLPWWPQVVKKLRKGASLREIYNSADILAEYQDKTMLRCCRMLIAEAEITRLKQHYGLPLDGA